MSVDPLRVSKRLKRRPVIVEITNENGETVEEKAVLIEMTGFQRDSYFERMQSEFAGPDGKVKKIAGLNLLLLEFTLWHCDSSFNPNGNELYSLEELKKLPAEAVDQLNEVAQKLCGLDKTSEEKAGNSPGKD